MREGKSFGDIIREEREKKGLSQKELAEKIGTTSSYICAIEKGNKPAPPYWTVKRIAEALEMDPEELWRIAREERDERARELADRLAYRRTTMALGDDRLKELHEEISSLKEEIRELKALLMGSVGDASGGSGKGGYKDR